MRLGRQLFILFTILILCGCSSGQDLVKIAKEDLGIVSIADGRKVYYGMKRADVESVLGQGKEAERGVIKYDSGVELFYRDDEVAAIIMEEEAKGIYKTAQNAEIGMSKDEIEQIYGTIHMPSKKELPLTYVYNMKKGVFLEEISHSTEEEAKNLLLIIASVDKNSLRTDMFFIYDSYYLGYAK
ncbi:hypothetical protein MKY48_16350 [Paenibacillus sp. FSL W8-0187]|uniref:hypothetical protein n=1 Tax=unclassified Paenibacillus TaxID=185978 RepID=UPI0030DB823F